MSYDPPMSWYEAHGEPTPQQAARDEAASCRECGEPLDEDDRCRACDRAQREGEGGS